MSLEIERKFLVGKIPSDLSKYTCHRIEQAYLSFDPEVRIRRKNDAHYLTKKGEGALVREEHETEISKQEYDAKMLDIQSDIIRKTRYIIPLSDGLNAELDIYHGSLDGLVVAEVEFSTEESAGLFEKPGWFGKEITYDIRFKNKYLAKIAYRNN